MKKTFNAFNVYFWPSRRFRRYDDAERRLAAPRAPVASFGWRAEVRSIPRPRSIPSIRQSLVRESTSSVASVLSKLPRTRVACKFHRPPSLSFSLSYSLSNSPSLSPLSCTTLRIKFFDAKNKSSRVIGRHWLFSAAPINSRRERGRRRLVCV